MCFYGVQRVAPDAAPALPMFIDPPIQLSHAAPILIADDESDDRFLLEHRLRRAGVANPLVAFRDGVELVEFFETLTKSERPKPWLLFLDLNMPLVDGFDVMEWLQAHPEFRDLPVAVITGSTKPADRDRVLRTGVKQYLEKFPTKSDLARVVAWASSQPSTSKYESAASLN